MNKKFYSLMLCMLSVGMLSAQNVSRQLNPIEKRKAELPAISPQPKDIQRGPVRMSDNDNGYTDGVFILNEDWFGHCNSTINFLYPDGTFDYRIFQKANPGRELGATAQFGTIFGDNMFITAKQEQDPGSSIVGGRFNVVDAKTMKVKTQLPQIGNGDGRAFVGVNDSTGYLGTNEGIYMFDIKNLEVGEKLKGSATDGGLYNGQVGMMVRTKTYVYAVQQSKGVLVINPRTNEIVKVIEGEYSTLAQSKDGNVWVGGIKNLLCINPETEEESFVPLPAGKTVPDSWYAWTAGVLCASTQENALFWTQGGGFNSGNEIYKYEIGNPSSLDKPFFTIPEKGRVLYVGAGLRVSPDDKLYLSVFENFGSVNYWQYVIDAKTGKQLACYKMDSHYWFPAMHIFPDKYAPVVKDFAPVNAAINDEPMVISLAGMAEDEDNIAEAIFKSVRSVSNPSLLSASVFGDNLTLTFNSDQSGEAVVEVDFDSNGKIVTKELKVSVNAKPLYLDRHEVSVNVGEEFTLSATDTTGGIISWSSSDEDVAAVTDGKVSAKKVGTARIMVKSGDNTDECVVNVINKATSISLETTDEPFVIQRDSTATINVTCQPEGAVLPKLTWSTSDNNIAHVSKSGVITALADGEAMIKVADTENPEIKDSCMVKVLASVKSVSLPETFVLNSIEGGKKHTATLKPEFVPAQPTNKKVTWKSSDEDVVKIDDNGKIEALKDGEAVITVTTDDGSLTAECKVSCVEWPEKITLDEKVISMGIDGSAQIKATVTPDTYAHPLQYVSSNPGVVTVDDEGNVTPLSYGESEITVSPANGAEVYAKCTVAVEIPVTSIVLDKDTIRQEAGTFASLTATVYPEDATFKDVTWKSTKMSYVRVSDDGQVSCVRPGESKVVVKSKYGNVCDTCVVIVEEVQVQEFSLKEHEISVDIDDNSYKLGYTYSPDNASDNEISFSSSDENILKVKDYNGQILPKGIGSAWVHASMRNGELRDSCLVHITSMIDSITFERENIIVGKDSTFTIGYEINVNPSVENEADVNKNVYWSTDDENIISVDDDGNITALAEGEAYVFVSTEYGDLYDYCLVTVVPEYIYTDGIKINETSVTLDKGGSIVLKAAVSPDNATNKNVIWSSSNEDIAVVSADGKVTALASGTASIIARPEDASFTTKCAVKVSDPALRPTIEVNGTDIIINVAKAEEATQYNFMLFKLENDKKELIKKFSTDDNGTELTTMTSNGDDGYDDFFTVELKNLESNTVHTVNVVAIRDVEGEDKRTIYQEYSEEFTTSVPTSVDGIEGCADGISVKDNMIFFNGMDGAVCYVSDMAGNVVCRFKVEGSSFRHGLSVPEGAYILNVNNGAQSTSVKIVIK